MFEEEGNWISLSNDLLSSFSPLIQPIKSEKEDKRSLDRDIQFPSSSNIPSSETRSEHTHTSISRIEKIFSSWPQRRKFFLPLLRYYVFINEFSLPWRHTPRWEGEESLITIKSEFEPIREKGRGRYQQALRYQAKERREGKDGRGSHRKT